MPHRPGKAPILVLLLAGCVGTDTVPAPAPWQALRATDTGPDRILFDVALVQSPLQDVFVDQAAWTFADEMIVPAAQRELLELNGYRVGLLVGPASEPLLNLLQTPRTCVERRGRSLPSGASLNQMLREAEGKIEGQLHTGRVARAVNWDRPRFSLDLTAELREEGRVRVRFTPRIESGDQALSFKPRPDESKWELEVKRAGRAVSELAWEVELLPNQVLLVGTRLEREGTAGYHSFVRPEGDEPMQRLLLLRHLRSANPEPDADARASPALAQQASGTSRPAGEVAP